MICPLTLKQVIEAQVDMPIVGAISLYVSLLTFTLRVHPDRLDYIDQVLVSLHFLTKLFSRYHSILTIHSNQGDSPCVAIDDHAFL